MLPLECTCTYLSRVIYAGFIQYWKVLGFDCLSWKFLELWQKSLKSPWISKFITHNCLDQSRNVFFIFISTTVWLKNTQYISKPHLTISHGQGKPFFFSRSGKSQGILHQVREILNSSLKSVKIVREFFYPDGWQPCSILKHKRADFDISVKLCPSGSNGNLRSAEKLSSTLKLSGFVDISKVCDDFSAQSQHY